MPKAVLRFDGIFTRQRVIGNVAVVAGGVSVVGRFLPTVELIAHDVAIDASRWVVREVARALSILKRERTKANEEPEQHAKNGT